DADRIDVRVVRANFRIIFGYVAEATHHQTAGFAQHIWFFDQRDALAPGFLGKLERLFANVGATLLAHDASREGDIFQTGFVFPLLHLRIGAQRGINRFWQREKLHAAVHAFGIFAEHNLIDSDVLSAGIGDLTTAI